MADYESEPTATGAVKLAFMVFDLTAFIRWLEACGIALCYPPTSPGTESRVTAIRDPDGNLIELTELGTVWLEHLKEHRATGGDLVRAWQATKSSPRP